MRPVSLDPEAARLLRPGGRLIFLSQLAPFDPLPPDDERIDVTLTRPYRGLHRIDWPGKDEGTSFHLGFGDMVRLLRVNGLEVEDYVELYAPEDATTRFPWANDEWATKWPIEEIWKARKRA